MAQNEGELKLYIFDEEILQFEDVQEDFYFGSLIFIAGSDDEAIAMFKHELQEMDIKIVPEHQMAVKPIVKGLVGCWGG